MLKCDARAKKIIFNSIKRELASDLDFVSSSAFEIYNIIKGINISDESNRIEEIKSSLSKTKFIPNEMPLSVFISNMSMKFNELGDLNNELNQKEKFDYLYNSLPEDLVIKSNLINHQGAWEEVTKFIIEVNRHLNYLKEKNIQVESNESTVLSTEIKSEANYNNNNKYNRSNNKKYNYNNNNKNFQPRNNNKYKYNINKQRNSNKDNVKCWNCGGLGHFSDECPSRKRSNNNSNQKFYKNNKGRHYRK